MMLQTGAGRRWSLIVIPMDASNNFLTVNESKMIVMRSLWL